jgi:thiol-disulfide isomerase/thioredoxin
MKSFAFFPFLMALVLAGCGVANQPEPGPWLALLLPDSTRPDLEIPFNMTVEQQEGKAPVVTITNGNEAIVINEILISGDSIHMKLPVFEGTIDARLSDRRMDGRYTHRAGGRSWSVPFHARQGITERFPELHGKPAGNITGRWELHSGPEDRAEKQVAEFSQQGERVTGTILTTTGDYRYLEGKLAGNTLALSAFDGAHALVFIAELTQTGGLENGIFSGGPSWNGVWKAFRNDTATLPDPKTLTFLKQGYEKIEFSFPGHDGRPVSLTDPEFAGHPVIVQIMGSWCPNCMDEARLLTALHNDYKDQGLRVVALCYESANRRQSLNAISRFREETGAQYPFLYAGESNKRKAAETLPMLNRILSFPTCIFIGRDGRVREIFTGFSGPGTGSHYTALAGEMRTLAQKLINEKSE